MPGVQRFFSKSVPAETLGGQHAGMRSDADHNFVDALSKVARDIEDRGGETREVLSDHRGR